MTRYAMFLICGLWAVCCQDQSIRGANALQILTNSAHVAEAPFITPRPDTTQVKHDAVSAEHRRSKLKQRTRVTLIQYNCSPNKKESVTRLLRLVAKSAPDSDLILLGETAFAPYTTCEDFSQVAETIPGPFTKSLSNLARQNQVHICTGLVERDGHQLFNTAVLIGPDGKILLKYRKTSLTTIDEKQFRPGNGPAVVETKLGRIGILICKDSQDFELISVLARQKPELILVPSYGLAKTDYSSKQKIDCMLDECIDEWRLRMQALAKVCHAFVLRADHVGMEDQQVRVGHSIAVSPGGYVIAEATMRPACLDVLIKADSPDQKHW